METTYRNLSETFTTGSQVIYALYGRCQIVGIESKTIGDQIIQFYKLEPLKHVLNRSVKKEPSIFLPVNKAIEQGLRFPISNEQSQEIFEILANREHYFPVFEAFQRTLPTLEACIRKEGCIGMAKVMSYLCVLKKRLLIATPDINKFYETVSRTLFREISEATGATIRSIEEKINKGFKAKLIPDN